MKKNSINVTRRRVVTVATGFLTFAVLLLVNTGARGQGNGEGFHVTSGFTNGCPGNNPTISSALPPTSIGPVTLPCVSGQATAAVEAGANSLRASGRSQHACCGSASSVNPSARIQLDNVVITGPPATTIPVSMNFRLRGTLMGNTQFGQHGLFLFIRLGGFNTFMETDSRIEANDAGILNKTGVFAPLTIGFPNATIDQAFVTPTGTAGPNNPVRLDLQFQAATAMAGEGFTEVDFFSGGNGFFLPVGAPVFNLPPGYTVNIPALDIVNNVIATNRIDRTSFFVRQHYLDFLNREPDSAGLQFWSNEIVSCGVDEPCIELKRINVSAAFFLSIEFQETGYLVYRVYKAAFGNLPGAPVPVRLMEFTRDSQEVSRGVVVGTPNWEALLEANKRAYLLSFVQQPAFVAAFPLNMTATDFVGKLNENAGNPLSSVERSNLISMLSAAPADPATRAEVLRRVAEDTDLRDAEFNKAFVLMEYFGYLRRNPNDAPDLNFNGYDFWLNKLNSFGGNFVNAEMVKAFIRSGEYRNRFGS